MKGRSFFYKNFNVSKIFLSTGLILLMKFTISCGSEGAETNKSPLGLMHF